ncbi:hypothetical protein CLAFUW4_11186 [Fulvia fulva]|uniref:Uncharacterized protein n=1 Tax=Passalora fulva TaxID=5499 RepID=A0A9Q8PBW3_PASFU|nr:uncharacterized protein CLAFUR5_10229 [Fulvia fulva]KAK4620051.1 hypothetical protein CLAFUR4_11191 [Fulvia fulva]KAK4620768.1 hypothetical protein CLAFUR0_11196 [Fulvia fulva]UJO19679.1 hypothetical protein CLAFUR5_10229 [Fulvia fulva]WPV17460.1 hypothetical protein CLAFUW4_11186 [Fulvia fulva]WPV31951.1 hypothetical protein CLAFUW7_11182 [Fulvia fulva]
MITIAGLLLALTLAVQAADQTPDVAYGLTVEHRPDTAWRPCRSTGDDRTNCGFCYGPTGGFLGWNCECDTFCSGTRSECYYILESDPGTYTKVSCVRA